MELPSLTVLGVLRESDERLTAWGFSPDSQTVWTQDTDSVLRFWNTDGTFRAKTPVRADRFVYPAGMKVDHLRTSIVSQPPNDVLVADGVAVCRTQYPDWEWQSDHTGQPTWMKPKEGSVASQGPVEMYSTRTGLLIRRLDRLHQKLSHWQLSPDKRWLIYVEYNMTDPQVVIVSSADGQELARLDHRLNGAGGEIRVEVSPTGKWVLTVDQDLGKESQNVPDAERYRLWSSASWQQVEKRLLQEIVIPRSAVSKLPHFVSDDDLAFTHSGGVGVLRIGQNVQVFRPLDLGLDGDWYISNLLSNPENTIIYSHYRRVLIDAKTLKKLNPPVGRRYAPELANLAPDGRFFEDLDTVTEKDLPSPVEYYRGTFHPGLGIVKVEEFGGLCKLHILPDPSKLIIPPAMLELWAQVVTGGELDADGQFVAWDEPTWQAKQEGLALMKPPYEGFPFPGWVATEPHLWWHIQGYKRIMELDEYDENSYNEFIKLSHEWRRRSGRVRSQPEPDTWRTPGPDDAAEESKPATSSNPLQSDTTTS